MIKDPRGQLNNGSKSISATNFGTLEQLHARSCFCCYCYLLIEMNDCKGFHKHFHDRASQFMTTLAGTGSKNCGHHRPMCVPRVYHVCTTCVPPVYNVCATCVPRVGTTLQSRCPLHALNPEWAVLSYNYQF